MLFIKLSLVEGGKETRVETKGHQRDEARNVVTRNLGSGGNDGSPQNGGTRMVSAVRIGAGEGRRGALGLRLLAWASGKTPEPFSETRHTGR